MGPLPCSCKILRSAAFRHAVTCFLITFLLASMVLADFSSLHAGEAASALLLEVRSLLPNGSPSA